jgi:hypothetical protein
MVDAFSLSWMQFDKDRLSSPVGKTSVITSALLR